jgi:hypothetical protein
MNRLVGALLLAVTPITTVHIIVAHRPTRSKIGNIVDTVFGWGLLAGIPIAGGLTLYTSNIKPSLMAIGAFAFYTCIFEAPFMMQSIEEQRVQRIKSEELMRKLQHTTFISTELLPKPKN